MCVCVLCDVSMSVCVCARDVSVCAVCVCNHMSDYVISVCVCVCVSRQENLTQILQDIIRSYM